MSEDAISKEDFNAAVAEITPTVKGPLLRAEAAAATLGLSAGHALHVNLAALHDALSAALVTADSMGSTDGSHARTGGDNKD